MDASPVTTASVERLDKSSKAQVIHFYWRQPSKQACDTKNQSVNQFEKMSGNYNTINTRERGINNGDFNF